MIYTPEWCFHRFHTIRVAINADHGQVDYVRAVLPEDGPLVEDQNLVYNRDVSHSYTIGPAGIPDEIVPGTVASLSENRPNPFKSLTAMRLCLPEREHVSITIYDIKGVASAAPRDDVSE